MTKFYYALLLTIISLLGHMACAGTLPRARFTSGEQRVSLIELYTSEGCNSCPPADHWLSTLRGAAGLWRSFVPMAFHVDYWDYLGWRDRFAQPAFGERQRRYAREGGTKAVYTPGVFVDGHDWRLWYKSVSPEPKQSSPGTLRIDATDGQAAIEFVPNRVLDDRLVVHLALCGMGLVSSIGAGENNGRTLKHDFVVLGLATARMAQAHGRYTAVLPLPETSIESPQLTLVGWVSKANRQAPIQATGGFLPPVIGTD